MSLAIAALLQIVGHSLGWDHLQLTFTYCDRSVEFVSSWHGLDIEFILYELSDMDAVDHIAELFGSQQAVAEAVGVTKSAVSNWRRSGVPDAAKWRLLQASKERCLNLDLSVFDASKRVKNA